VEERRADAELEPRRYRVDQRLHETVLEKLRGNGKLEETLVAMYYVAGHMGKDIMRMATRVGKDESSPSAFS
jgi:hypothetical protein